MAVGPETPIELIEAVYANLDQRVGALRERLGRPLTLAEKILGNHLDEPMPRSRGRQLCRFPSRPSGHARRNRPDGLAPVHDRRPERGRGTDHHPL